MRPISKLRKDVLTAEEWDYLVEWIRKRFLFALLTEAGYNTIQMTRLKYTSKDLHNRLLAAIRGDKLEIQRLKEARLKDREKLMEQTDLFTGFLKEQKEKKMNRKELFERIAETQDNQQDPLGDDHPVSKLICWAIETAEEIGAAENNLGYAINELTKARQVLAEQRCLHNGCGDVVNMQKEKKDE